MINFRNLQRGHYLRQACKQHSLKRAIEHQPMRKQMSVKATEVHVTAKVTFIAQHKHSAINANCTSACLPCLFTHQANLQAYNFMQCMKLCRAAVHAKYADARCATLHKFCTHACIAALHKFCTHACITALHNFCMHACVAALHKFCTHEFACITALHKSTYWLIVRSFRALQYKQRCEKAQNHRCKL